MYCCFTGQRSQVCSVLSSTVLRTALVDEDIPLIERMLAYGAQVDLYNPTTLRTVLMTLVQRGMYSCPTLFLYSIILLSQLGTVEYISDYLKDFSYVNVNAKDINGWTAGRYSTCVCTYRKGWNTICCDDDLVQRTIFVSYLMYHLFGVMTLCGYV